VLSHTRANNTWKLDNDYVYRGATLIASFSGAGTAPERHYHADHLGSTRLVTDGFGFRLAIHTYWPFGPEAVGSETDAERLKFTGHERDSSPATSPGFDLDYMHARYYDANAGRFLTVDPAAGKPTRPQTWNRYAYVTNRPTNAFDPDGRYLVDFHHDATLILALAAGMWPHQARMYADWTQRVDDNPATQPVNTVAVQRDYHFVSNERLEQLRRDSWDGNPRAVGTFLHALQDSYSHAGYNAGVGHYGAAVGGLIAGGLGGGLLGYDYGHAVDITGNRPGVAMQAAFASYSYLAALAKREDGRAAVSWSSIEGALLGFFENSDNPTKRKFYYDWLCKRVGCTEETPARTVR
jgi:RHS repeat-associated protein